MSSDAPLRKVRAGDALRIVDADYNAFIDAALARRGQQHNLGQGPPHVQAIVTAQNVSGEDAPMHAPCSMVGEVFGGSGIFRFDKPDEGPYGILLEPVPASDLGLVAMAGGPYQVNVHAESGPVAGGDSMLPVSGQWAVEQGIGPFAALTTVAEGTCWVVFSRGLAPGAQMVRAQQNMTANHTPYDVKYLASDGSVSEQTVHVYRPNGVRVDAGDTGFVGIDINGANIFIPCHARHDEGLSLTVETRTSDPANPEKGRIWFRTDF